MSLPGFDFNAWQQQRRKSKADLVATEITTTTTEENRSPQHPIVSAENSPLQRRNLALKERKSPQQLSQQQQLENSSRANKRDEVGSRALISQVAEYYESYVQEMGLEEHFWNGVTVTNVFPVRVQGGYSHQKQLKAARWMVTG